MFTNVPKQALQTILIHHVGSMDTKTCCARADYDHRTICRLQGMFATGKLPNAFGTRVRSPAALTMTAVSCYVYDLSQGMARAMSMAVVGKQVDIVPHTGIGGAAGRTQARLRQRTVALRS